MKREISFGALINFDARIVDRARIGEVVKSKIAETRSELGARTGSLTLVVDFCRQKRYITCGSGNEIWARGRELGLIFYQ